MKKITLLFMGVLAASALTMAHAPVEPTATKSGFVVTKSGSSLFKVIYKSPDASNVRVSIYNDDHQLVFSETLRNKEGFLRPYNFTGLPEGEYTIELSDGSGKQVQRVSYDQQTGIQTLFHVSKVGGEEGKYLLTASGEDQITVRITDANNDLIHSATHNLHGEFAQVYNLQKVKGAFTIELTDSKGASKTVSY